MGQHEHETQEINLPDGATGATAIVGVDVVDGVVRTTTVVTFE